MPNTSIFSDEWRDCLRAHYTTVMRMNDKITEKTLRGVMHEAGFTDAELKELTVRATLRVEDVDADFVPDMDILEAEPVIVPGVAIAVPQQVIEAALVADAVEMDEAADATRSDVTDLDESEFESEGDTESETVGDDPPADPDVTQLSLF